MNNTVLENQQFYLRPFTQDDFWLLYNLRNEKAVIDMMQCNPLSEEKILSILERYQSLMDSYNFTNFAVFSKNTNDFVGSCGFSLFHDPDLDRNILNPINSKKYENRDVEIGYVLRQKYWGQGYAKQIAKLCIDYLFKNNPDISRIVAVTALSNLASQKVLEALGFEFIQNIQSKEYGLEKFYLLNKQNQNILKKQADQ